ncbi:hypothetical protein DL768_010618 [Monosporascus sp. mg162]|nr:hypothetical protein DL768_010618 [Monosporascus sp. mg162]
MAILMSYVETPSNPPATDSEIILICNDNSDDNSDFCSKEGTEDIYDSAKTTIIDYRKRDDQEHDMVETYKASSFRIRTNEISVNKAEDNCDGIYQSGGKTEPRNNRGANDKSADKQEVKAIDSDNNLAKRSKHNQDVYDINGIGDCTGIDDPGIEEPTDFNANDGLGSSNVGISETRDQLVISQRELERIHYNFATIYDALVRVKARLYLAGVFRATNTGAKRK